MTPIDELLSRARLIDEPRTPRDVVPRAPLTARAPTAGAVPEAGSSRREEDQASAVADRDLQALCEALVSSTPATALREFLTEQVPEPDGARVLGCILQLADADDGARSWWQYAAGAGDRAASYCLYLHHLSLGEDEVAAWWHQQTQVDADPEADHPQGDSGAGRKTAKRIPHSPTTPGTIRHFDTSTPTVLRVFRHLLRRTNRPRTEFVDALMHYVPTAVAVGYVTDEPDVDLPLPGPDFADEINDLVAVDPTVGAGRPSGGCSATAPRLPERQELRS
ncbi:hypothetical protein ACFWVP_03975 [Streptomyces sp. NPDC058637]|uniref:hypothetical protein n=1 Tax=Streptomyces sp. NPDC058637 TaxID=3346569 RepID=UPI0036497DC4